MNKIKYKSQIGIPIMLSFFVFSSCSNNMDQENSDGLSTTQLEQSSIIEPSQLKEEFLGIYHGIQPGYYLKNQYGDDLLIGGKRVPVPPSDYKFILKENNIVSLQQTSLDNGKRYFLKGTIEIISDDSNLIKLNCPLNDGEGLSPTIILVINKLNKNAICIGNNEPEFKLKKLSSQLDIAGEQNISIDTMHQQLS